MAMIERNLNSYSEPSRYDVFLSFRGPDTRRGFTAYLCSALGQSEVNVFMDDEELRKGEELNDTIMMAIENSRIAIVVFSPEYASSRWCLDEVAKIMECRKSKGLIVVPVYYGVNPSDVKHKTGRYEEAWVLHGKIYPPEVLERWRIALKEATDFRGFTSGDRSESLLIKDIVSGVLSILEMPVTDPSELLGRYDVYLSFRGSDTRLGFTGHLYSALVQSEVSVFMDEDLPIGIDINDAFKALVKSRIAIVVFSKEFASSRWCLKEVAHIMECRKSKGLIVLPVFYDIDPSDVRNQKGRYGDAFAHYEECYDPSTVESWRIALREAGQLSGFAFIYGYEGLLIQEIVRAVLSTQEPEHSLEDMPFHLPRNLVGMDSHLKAVYKILEMDKDDVHMVAFCGMGGIGKTTIAKTIFNKIARNFEYKCFSANVRETCQDSMTRGLLKLQKELLSRMLGETIDIWDVDQGANEIKQRCGKTKTLLVIDDVSHPQQLEKLAGASDWFGPESRVIITTREEGLVNGRDDVKLYPVPELERDDAEQLFRAILFFSVDEIKEYEEHISKVLDSMQGLPLAVKVVAAHLRRKKKDEWVSALKVLRENPDREIFDVLRLSYDDLNDLQKETLLDIACFFKGQPETYVRNVLECCKLHPDSVMGDLLSRYLISVTANKVDMHDMIQDMGREIVRRESPCPWKRSRLWSQEAFTEVLTRYTGTETIQGIKVEFAAPKKVEFDANALETMGCLRVFIAHNVIPPGNSINFPRELRWLEWPEYPSLSLPLHHHNNRQLVGLSLSKSHIILSEDDLKPFGNLKFINFSKCTSLRKIPDLSSLFYLESLDAEECKELVEVHQSLGLLEKPVRLNFLNCNKLRTFPITLNSRALQHLLLKGCLKLSKFPEILVEMENLKELALDNTGIDELPSSIENLVGLEEFYLENCRKLKTLPSSIYRLQKLQIASFADCFELGEFPEYRDGSSDPLPALIYLDLQRCGLQKIDFLKHLGCKTTLENLDLSGSKLGTVPKCIEEFISLQQLNLENCEQLHEIRGLPPKINYLIAKGCKSLKWHVPLSEMLKSPLKESPRLRHIDFSRCLGLPQRLFSSAKFFSVEDLLVDSQIKILYPGSEIPKWFDHQNVDGSLRFPVNSKLYKNIAGLAFCVIMGSGGRKISLSCEIQVYNNNHMTYHIADIFHSVEMDHMWLVYVPCTMMWGWETKMPKRCSEFKVLFKLSRSKLKCCGVHLLLKEDGSREGSNTWMHQRFK